MGFAARLRQERLRRHLSQETLAEALGVSARTISRWEQGRGIPQAILRVQLSRYFELSPEVFFEESETLASPLREEAEEPDEAVSLAAPVLPEHDSRDPAVLVDMSQEAKVSNRSALRPLLRRRGVLLGLGVLGLMVLLALVVFFPLAALSPPAKGAAPHVTPGIAASSPVPISLTATANKASTPSAGNNRGTYICWGAHVHLPAQCLDLKNDRFRANQPISLWSSRSRNGLGWTLSIQGEVTSTWPFTVSSLNTRYHGKVVVFFEKTTSAGHNGCIGVNSTAGLAWERCGHADTYWVISTYGYLVNVSYSNRGGIPAAAGACDSSNGGSIGLGFENQPNQCLGPWTIIS